LEETLVNIKVLMITYNRPDYTEMSLEHLCNTAPKNLKVSIWDNGSDEKTRQVVEKFRGHKCVERVILIERNDKLWGPTNWFWENSLEADLLGKVDDDCLVPENWCEVLEEAHNDIPEVGVLGCWRFLPEDFVPEKSAKKIWTYGNHRILRNCWIEGSGYLMKRKVIERNGVLRTRENFTFYCLRAAAAGFVNGWYYPFLYQEHMDDPRSVHSGIRTEEDFQRLMPLSARNFKIATREEWLQDCRKQALIHQEFSIDPYDFIGFRARIKRKVTKLFGGEYFPKVK
jgi:glycosyltransferase involved in cell wall biosynthesis